MQVQGGSFEPTQKPAGYEITVAKMNAPDFPAAPTNPASYQAGATVYLVLKIGPDGKVLDLLDEQVNLHFVPDWGTDGRWRNHFASSALRTARGWRFNPPTQGEAAGLPYWSVRLPVRYIPWNERIAYGQWVAYVPGPRRAVPWLSEDEQRTPLEGMAANVLHRVGQQDGLKLREAAN